MRPLWIWTVITAAIPALGEIGGQPSGAPTLALLKSLDLRETDSAFVGRAIGFAVSPRGLYYISDDLNSVVHEYSDRGERLRSFGRRGRGPGEFNSVGFLALGGDSILVVDGGSSVHVFDIQTGALKWQRLAPAKMIQAMAVHGPAIYLNSVVGRNLGDRTSIVAFSSPSDTLRFGGPLPSPLGRNPAVDQSFSVLQFAFYKGDSILFAVTASSGHLFRGRFRDKHFDSLPVARTTRRGTLSDDVLSKFNNNPASLTAKDLFQPSTVWAVGALPGDKFAYVAYDAEMTNNRVTGPIYLSVVDGKSRRSCAEVRVPVPTDPAPRVILRSDTLLVLSQDETVDKKPVTTIRKFRIGTEKCRWVP